MGQKTILAEWLWAIDHAYTRWIPAALLALLGLASCSGGRGASPAPSPSVVNVSGTWAGTVTYTAGTATGQENFQMTLVQAAGTATVTGTYQAERFNGGIRGQTTANAFSGTFDFTSTVQGDACVGTFDASGPAGNDTMTLTSPIVNAPPPCANVPANLTITVRRQ